LSTSLDINLQVLHPTFKLLHKAGLSVNDLATDDQCPHNHTDTQCEEYGG
jgi:hypothetical protein